MRYMKYKYKLDYIKKRAEQKKLAALVVDKRSKNRKRELRPLHDVFKKINMHRGDKTVCWEWQGSMSPYPLFFWGGRRVQARRVVYGLRNGIHPDNCPRISTSCGNDYCLNPDHLVAEHSALHRLIKWRELTPEDECDSYHNDLQV